MRRKTIIGGILLAVLLSSTMYVYLKGRTASESLSQESSLLKPSPDRGDIAEFQTEEEQLYTFVTTRLAGPQGIYTNLMDTAQNGTAATGHEVLSESASILMRYAVLAGNRGLFDRQWELAETTFNMEGGFSYRYSPRTGKRYPVNAAVDDLRLIQGLNEAGERFAEPLYSAEAEKYGRRFYNNNVNNGYMRDFYDDNYKNTNEFITLCYINLRTLRNLSIDSEKKKILLRNMNNIVDKGYLSDAFPFYETRYDYETGKYISENINTVESLLTILELAEVGGQRPASIEYIKQQVQRGTLYGQYTREGAATTSIRSTAIYAITAMIGAEIGDDTLYLQSIQRMNEFRVNDKDSILYGGFGDVRSREAYSFDNLLALLAYRY